MSTVSTIIFILIKAYAIMLLICIPIGIFATIKYRNKLTEEPEFIHNMREHYQRNPNEIWYIIVGILAFIGLIAIWSLIDSYI